MPASRRARATTFAPRSCPSSPAFATSTRTGFCATVAPCEGLAASDLRGAAVNALVPVECASVRPGIHLLHKRPGETSFSLVRAFAEKTGLRACHGGALDPFAEGLLLILAGPATRLFELLHPVPKTYQAEIAWGIETDNGDPLGVPVGHGDASPLEPAQLDSAVIQHLGWREQVPPATSNKRIEGERAYLRAHRGEEVVLPPSRVYLHEARFLAHDLPRSSRLRLVARGGYYVRALVRDLGREVGSRAHLTTLRRLSIGPWNDPAGDAQIVTGPGVIPW